MDNRIDSLSASFRYLTYATAVLYAAVGIILFLAPDWSAANFPWKISPFIAMTMAGWYLGSAYIAWQSARIWRWPAVYACLIFLWAFALLEAAVLFVHRAALRVESPIAWLYMLMLTIAVVAALKGIYDWIRQRPQIGADGLPLPGWMRLVWIAFTAFVFFLALVALIAPKPALEGKIFPESMTLFTLRSFGAFYCALGIGAFPLIWSRTFTSNLPYLWGGLSLIVPITIAAFLNWSKFDLVTRPGGLIYIGVYLIAFVGVLMVLAYVRARRARTPVHATA